MIADELTWQMIGSGWSKINQAAGVSRFHAAHLNGRTYEYSGWSEERRRAYSAALLSWLAVFENGIAAISCGIFADEYRRLISDAGRRKFGSPYMVCFNSCVTAAATWMAQRPPKDRLSVVLDKDNEAREAEKSFTRLRDHSTFLHKYRLSSCSIHGMESTCQLQVADLIAYEIFKAMSAQRRSVPLVRYPISSILTANTVREGYFDTALLERLKPWIEATPCKSGYLVFTPTYDHYAQDRPNVRGPGVEAAIAALERAVQNDY